MSLSPIQASDLFPHPSFHDQIRLFWMRRVSGLYSSISPNILREVCDYLRIFISLAFFSGSSLEVHAFPGHSVKTVQMKESVVGCIIAHMNFWEILCVGTYPTSTSVSSVNLRTFVLKKEEDMRDKRNCPGVIRVNDWVYVFGGYSGGPITTSSEKFSINERFWKKLPDMDLPRVYFSPVLHRYDIYLCDAAAHTCLSSFNIISETYTSHSVAIPSMQTNASVAFIASGELVVAMHPHSVLRWRVGSAFPFVIIEKSEKKLQGFSCTEVVQVGRSVFWTDYNAKKVVKFDLDTLDYDFFT